MFLTDPRNPVTGGNDQNIGETYAEKAYLWIHARLAEGKTVHVSTMTNVTAVSPRTAKSWAAKGLTLFKLSPDGLRMAAGKRFDLITSTTGPLCRISAQ